MNGTMNMAILTTTMKRATLTTVEAADIEGMEEKVTVVAMVEVMEAATSNILN